MLMFSDLVSDRRDVLTTTASLLGLGAAGSLAGCSGDLLGGGSESPTSSRQFVVPATASAVFAVDVAAVLNDQPLRAGINRRLESLGQAESYSGPTSVSQALSQAQSATGVDLRKLRHLTVFSGMASNPGYGGAIVRADWSVDTLVDRLSQNSDATYSKTTYEGTTLYESGQNSALAVLSSGTFVIGGSQPVRDVVDVAAGRADPMSGKARQLYDGTQGMVRFASPVPQSATGGLGQTGQFDASVFTSVTHVTGSIRKQGSKRTLSVSLVASDESAATEVKKTLESGASLAQQRLQQFDTAGQRAIVKQLVDDATQLAQNTQFSRSGNTITASYTGPPEQFAGSVFVTFSLALGVFINTAGFLQSKSESTGEQSSQQVSNRLVPVSSVGDNISDGTIGTVRITVKKAPGAANIDLRRTTANWVSSSGTYKLASAAAGTSGADGYFGLSPIKGEGETPSVLSDPDDRVQLVFDLGSDDVDSDDVGETTSFGERLSEGTQATVQFTTPSDAQTVLQLTVPQSLAGQDAVQL